MSAAFVPSLEDRLRIGAAKEQALRDARTNLHVFGQLLMTDGEGKPIAYHVMHLSWIAHVNYCWRRGLHAGIFAHFGSGKTSVVVPLAAWLIGRNPQERIKLICAADVHAAQRVAAVRNVMESPGYRQIFPGVVAGDKWTDHMLYVERKGYAIDPTIEARGVHTAGAGGRATTILFDDVVDLQNSIDEAQRLRVKTAFHKVWMTRLEPPRRVLYVANPWDADDLSHNLRESIDWCWLEQRVDDGLTCYEQEVWNAGPDYQAEVDQNIAEMLGPTLAL